jgi:hypothetical protein
MVTITFHLICQESFHYCIQKFEGEEDTVQSGHFEFPIFYQKYIVISEETLS